MELTYNEIRTYWQARHPGQRIPAREKVAVRCAMHDEKNASCTLFLDGNGGFHCNACGAKGNLFQFEARFSNCTLAQAERNVADITGATPSPSLGDLGPPVAFYDYRDENGTLLFQKRRYEPELKSKTFLVYRATDKGLVSKIDPETGAKTRRVLYNLPDLVKANVVFLCEGEKDCINLGNANLFLDAGFSIACTCTFDGAWQKKHSPKWLESYNSHFTGKQVFIFADNDEPGREYAETAAAGIAPFAYRVRVVYFPELPEHGDVTDYLALHAVAELEEKIKSAPVWKGQASDRENWLVDAVEWSSTASPKVDYRVDGVIQSDANGIIAAEPKTGKSLCALDICISLACGVPWLGRKVPRRVRTAYISREDSPLLTKARIKGFLLGKGIYVDPTGWLWCNTRNNWATSVSTTMSTSITWRTISKSGASSSPSWMFSIAYIIALKTTTRRWRRWSSASARWVRKQAALWESCITCRRKMAPVDASSRVYAEPARSMDGPNGASAYRWRTPTAMD
jgi:hypothetical protein